MVAICTIFQDIYADKPFYVEVDKALQRIKTGKSRLKIEEIRTAMDKNKQEALKKQLPSVCFSGKFSERQDDKLIEHSGFLILDFDNVEDIDVKMAQMQGYEFVYAAWISPRGNGVKALVKIADGKKHREHFEALKELFPLLDENGLQKHTLTKTGKKKFLYEVDPSGVNPSRVCFESWDEHIYINKKALPFTKTKQIEFVEGKEQVQQESEVFKKLLTWLSNRNDAFVTGERNTFIFKLASACCRFGINEHTTAGLILTEYPSSNDFKQGECMKAIRSGYKANNKSFGSAIFERDILIEKVSRKEVELDAAIFDETVKPKDVIYGADVKNAALNIYRNGYPFVQPIGVPALDELFKMKRGEITLLTGIGNYGKSSFFKWYQLMRAIKFGEKFAVFAPEEYPPEEYYHDFAEMLLGCDCSGYNPNRPSIEIYSNAFDFASKHVFYVYPKDEAPTPDYIKERFLELIIKEKIDGCTIDPFNQMANDYQSANNRDDKYLELVLSRMTRFTQVNNIYMPIIAHPNKMSKGNDGNYPCPDVFDVNGGAMWNNKMDNIIVYHRPFMQTEPDNPAVEFHSKKIRKQKSVGKKGFTMFEYHRKSRRFMFDGIDYMQKLLNEKGYTFQKEQATMSFNDLIKPIIIDEDDWAAGYDRTNEF
jgi:hypothetical protein